MILTGGYMSVPGGVYMGGVYMDFNPTKKDLLLIDQLLLDIKSKKNAFINRKISLQNSLSQLKDKYKNVPFEGKEFKRIKNTRQNVKEHLHGIELKIKTLNDELIYKNKLRLEIEFHLKHNRRLEGKEDLDRITSKILSLKVKYSDFTKDRTRIASLRIMASEFIDELEKLLK